MARRRNDEATFLREVFALALRAIDREMAEARHRLDALVAQQTKLKSGLKAMIDEPKAAPPLTFRGSPTGELEAALERAPRARRGGKRRRKPLSAAARRKIRAATKRRWAEAKKNGKTKLGD